jgi:predicted nucleic acid-binding protein
VILCDTGPMVALIDKGDPDHGICYSTLTQLPKRPLLTTWACLTEAMYLMYRAGGHIAQEALWEYLEKSLIILHVPGPEETNRIHALMKQYRDVPMDFADASLVAAAETLELTRIFTLDSHFYAYRIGEKRIFDIVPSSTTT